MNSKKILRISAFAVVITGILLSSCGPMPDELAATEAALTTAAATATPTPSPTRALPALSEAVQMGDHVAVFLPEDWDGGGDWFGIFSPVEINFSDYGNWDVSQPLLEVFPLDADEFIYGEFGSHEEALNAYAEFMAIVPSTLVTVIEGDVSWTRGAFHGSMGEFEGTWQGWIALALPGPEGLVIIASAPEDEWGEYEDIFEAILHGVDFAFQMDAAGHTDRGHYFIERGDFQSAINEFMQAIALNPECVDCYLFRGIAYFAAKNLDLALADFDQAIAMNPECADCHRFRAITLDASGDHDAAMDDFNQAISLDPDNAFAYNDRGYSYWEHGDLDGALADVTQAMALNSRCASCYNLRGLVYMALENVESAIADYSQAIDLDSRYAVYYTNRGDAYSTQEDYDLAIADFTQAIDLNPQDARAYVQRGYAYAQIGEDALAIADLETALALGLPPDLTTIAEDLLEDLNG